ncbi:MAG TPA: DUF362 domain-containing protein [Anaerolineales bacterium]|nr:DUF362 domain-containing protein [Anaerolineales bacterium]
MADIDTLRVGVAKITDLVKPANQLYTQENLTRLIRECVAAAFQGSTVEDHPLNRIVEPGMSVLIKPNWVHHYNQFNNGKGDLDCMYTQHAFTIAVLKEVVEAGAGQVIIGDAPVQGCNWQELITPGFLEQVDKVCGNTPIKVVDFRRSILNNFDMVTGVQTDLRDESRFILFNLGIDSLLEQISHPPGRFRVTMYDPRKLAATHAPGVHQYLVCREAFEADLILNLPKLKTHRKAGLTGALKNLVGINGNKDYLPHHRVGGTSWGGDCYPGFAPLKRLAEYFLDRANQNIGTKKYTRWERLAHGTQHFHGLFGDPDLEGGWFGNDTTWRMALDINRILIYGCLDGSMADTPQRQVWSLSDAIICGQGEGPLAPEACLLGVVTFSNSPPAADWVHALLLGMDPRKIPLVREAFSEFRWPLAPTPSKVEVRYQNRAFTNPYDVHKLGIEARPARGWASYCELRATA